MSKSIRKEIVVPQPREQVWRALTEPATLAEWMFPNDFEPRVGHRFTFRVPGNPAMNFDGLTVHCEVLQCDPPSDLAFSWAAGALADTRVSFQLQPIGEGTRVVLEHSGFDVTSPFGQQAFAGAAHGWTRMLGQLSAAVQKLVGV